MSDALVLPPVPLVDVDSAPWWESLEGGTLSVARCRACRRWSHPPLERCRTCGGDNALEPVSGQGSIFSFIVVRHQSLPGLVPPYVVAIVELDEQQGLRMSGIVANEPDAIRVGARVTARIEQIGDTGFSAPAFDLTTDASTDRDATQKVVAEPLTALTPPGLTGTSGPGQPTLVPGPHCPVRK